ncbi:hypothetical protein HPP92_011344 [Vanilla planifolia]|uniref:Uncharacterized protein n=1 Tax=Vanilla planifolia TaxID=51239 RepID=A0A835R0N8_VANPL|nr:hypothetical protein HPP92_011344 [Vanilla planifolia]
MEEALYQGPQNFELPSLGNINIVQSLNSSNILFKALKMFTYKDSRHLNVKEDVEVEVDFIAIVVIDED